MPASKKAKNVLRRERAIEGRRGPGQPTMYRPEFNSEVERLCKLGVRDIDIALFFDVALNTVRNWQKTHPEFFLSMLRGKQQADIKVAETLYKNAIGYDYEEESAVKVKTEVMGANGKLERTEETVKIVKLKKHARGDTTAQIFYLKNRRPDLWRDVTTGPEEEAERKVKVHVGVEILEGLKARGHVMLEGTYELVEDDAKKSKMKTVNDAAKGSAPAGPQVD